MLAYNQKSFLIVDDFSDFRSSVRSMLRELGVKEVDTADSGEQALRMCSQKRYDFVLHDFNLGDGRKNGQQVLEDLMIERLLSYESVFIMVTAENSQAMVMSALEWEPDGYLTKPFNRAGLAQRLEKLVQRKTYSQPGQTLGGATRGCARRLCPQRFPLLCARGRQRLCGHAVQCHCR